MRMQGDIFMLLGTALVFIFVLYLVDKNGKWRAFAKVVAALVLLFVLGIAGVYAYYAYDRYQDRKKDEANVAAQARQEQVVAQQQANVLKKTCTEWEAKPPLSSPVDVLHGN